MVGFRQEETGVWLQQILDYFPAEVWVQVLAGIRQGRDRRLVRDADGILFFRPVLVIQLGSLDSWMTGLHGPMLF